MSERMMGHETGTGQAASTPPIPKMEGADAARQAAQAAKDAASQAKVAATQAKENAKQATQNAQGGAPKAPQAPTPPGDLTTSTGDNPFDPAVMARMQSTAENVSYMFFVTIAVIIVGLPLARALGRRISNPAPPKPLPSEDLGPKLRQLQESVDAMAVELERISENQRFTTKLLAERPPAAKLEAAALEPPRQG